MTEMNLFEDIKGFEGLYQINRNGDIWSYHYKKIMKNLVNESGYYYIRLTDENKKKTKCSIHRLLAIQYIPNPENKPVVDHIDRNRINNSLENLRWVTIKENGNNIKKANGTLFIDKSTTERTGKEYFKAACSITDENGIRITHQKSSHNKEVVEKWLEEIKETNEVPIVVKELPTEEEIQMKIEHKKEYQKIYTSTDEYKEKKKISNKIYRDENKEKTSEYDKKRYEENKEQIKQKSKEYREANAEEVKVKKMKHYNDHKQKINEGRKQKYKENAEEVRAKTKAYYEANKDAINEKKRQMRAAKKAELDTI
jgi:hypothetical protein